MLDSLEQVEKDLLVAALYAVSPTGGGSAPFSLARKLAKELNVNMEGEGFQKMIGSLQMVAYNEVKEYAS